MKTILHLDDNHTARAIMEKTLGRDVKLINANSIQEALSIITHHTIDCFIIDYVLIQDTGVDFGIYLRATEKFKNTPLILVSSIFSDEIIFKAMKSGFNQCISKLADPEKIHNHIMRQLEEPTRCFIEIRQVAVNCITWESEGRFYQYSPDLNIRVEAKTSQGAFEKMEAILTESLQSHNNSIGNTEKLKPIVHKISSKSNRTTLRELERLTAH